MPAKSRHDSALNYSGAEIAGEMMAVFAMLEKTLHDPVFQLQVRDAAELP